MLNDIKFREYLLNGLVFKTRKPLKEEEALTYNVRQFLTHETLEGRLPYVWFHVANEVSNQIQVVFGAKLKSLGKLPGVADFIFLGNGKCAALELKSSIGILSKTQKIFKEWCAINNVKYGVARTLDEAKAFVKDI